MPSHARPQLSSIARRLRPTFSLATLFTVVTVLAVMLGQYVKTRRCEREAARALEALGADIEYYYEEAQAPGPPGPRWLAVLLGDEHFFADVHGVSFEAKPTDEAWDQLAHLPSLKALFFLMPDDVLRGQADGYEVDLSQAWRLRRFEFLGVAGGSLTGRAVKQLRRCSSFRTLLLIGCEMDDEAVMALDELPGLRGVLILWPLNPHKERRVVRRMKALLPNVNIH